MISLPNPVDAVIFDMDGLLLDTETICIAAIMGASRAVGFEVSEAFCHAMIGVPSKECDLMMQERFGTGFPMDEYRRECSALMDRLVDAGIPIKPGAIELIEYLSEHDISIAIATSSSRRITTRNLQKSGLFDRFDVIVTRDEVQHGKPHPDLFVRAAAELNARPGHCLSLEDSPNGIRSAHGAGTMPVMVPDILMPTEDIRAMCIAVVETLHEVRLLMSV